MHQTPIHLKWALNGLYPYWNVFKIAQRMSWCTNHGIESLFYFHFQVPTTPVEQPTEMNTFCFKFQRRHSKVGGIPQWSRKTWFSKGWWWSISKRCGTYPWVLALFDGLASAQLVTGRWSPPRSRQLQSAQLIKHWLNCIKLLVLTCVEL